MFNATIEQQAILANVLKGESIVVNAFAGAGKTSTLKYITDNIPGRILYVAFTKPSAEEAEKKFPKHVSCRTLHSLAYETICKGTPFAKRIQNFYDYQEIAGIVKDLTIRENVSKLVADTIEVIKAFCNSSDMVIQASPEADEWELVVITAANRVWQAMTDRNGKASITHDIYFKLWHLQKPTLSNYSLVLLDEAQDSNPPTIDIIRDTYSSGTQIVLVGDRYQAIYGWRGATNAMTSFPNLPVQYLTESFRFNQDIADKANVLLEKLGSPVTMIGRGTGSNLTDSATLVRSNASLFQLMIKNAAAGQYMYVKADLKELWSAMYTANAMKFAFHNESKVDWPKYVNKQFQAFGTWNELVKCEQQDIKRIVRLVEQGYGHKDIQQIKCFLVDEPENADVLLLTGHKAKGLEYSKVTVNKDFLPRDYEEGLTEKVWNEFVADQGANLLYVALTRARDELVMDDEVEQFLQVIKETEFN